MNTVKAFHPRRSSGSALIIALIILMVMTLIGLTSMNTSILEEKMAGSMFNRNLAFQAAESALRQGEDWITSQSVLPDLCACYLSDDDSCACTGSDRIWDVRATDPDLGNNRGWWDEPEWNPSNPDSWWCTNSVLNGNSCSDPKAIPIATSSSDTEWMAGVAAPPAFVIEELPPVPESLEVGKSVDDNDIYLLVTARGVGGTESSVVLLQTTYKW